MKTTYIGKNAYQVTLRNGDTLHMEKDGEGHWVATPSEDNKVAKMPIVGDTLNPTLARLYPYEAQIEGLPVESMEAEVLAHFYIRNGSFTAADLARVHGMDKKQVNGILRDAYQKGLLIRRKRVREAQGNAVPYEYQQPKFEA